MEVAVLSDTIDEILKEITSLTTTTSGTGLSPTDIQQLKDSLNKIQPVVDREKQNHVQGKEVLDWLRKLKTAVNDLNDLVEEISANTSPLERKTHFFKSNPIKHRLKVINSKFKNVIEHLQGVASNLPKSKPTPSEEARKKRTKLANLDPEIDPIGREKEKKEIIDQLIFLGTKTRESKVIPVHVVTIVGVAGIGKTKLAHLIYDDEKVKAHFGSQFWVHGDTKTVDVELESIEERVTETSPTTERKGSLVVLDDLRSAEIGDTCLSQLQLILTGPGGAILITTRSKLVANKVTASIRSNLAENDNNNIAAITTVKPHVLMGLNEEDSWSLFRKIRRPSSTDVERMIVMDCEGVPKWIIMAAILLNNHGEAQVANFKEEFLQELKLMYYDDLPWRQKLCFASFSLFPKDHLIDPERLIHLWIAEAFLISTTNEDSKSVEENLRAFQLLQRDA